MARADLEDATQARCFALALPTDIWVHEILPRFSRRDLVALSKTCRCLRTALYSAIIELVVVTLPIFVPMAVPDVLPARHTNSQAMRAFVTKFAALSVSQASPDVQRLWINGATKTTRLDERPPLLRQQMQWETQTMAIISPLMLRFRHLRNLALECLSLSTSDVDVILTLASLEILKLNRCSTEVRDIRLRQRPMRIRALRLFFNTSDVDGLFLSFIGTNLEELKLFYNTARTLDAMNALGPFTRIRDVSLSCPGGNYCLHFLARVFPGVETLRLSAAGFRKHLPAVLPSWRHGLAAEFPLSPGAFPHLKELVAENPSALSNLRDMAAGRSVRRSQRG